MNPFTLGDILTIFRKLKTPYVFINISAAEKIIYWENGPFLDLG